MILDSDQLTQSLQPKKNYALPYLRTGKVTTPSPQHTNSPLLTLPDITNSNAIEPNKPQLSSIRATIQLSHKFNALQRNKENITKLELKTQIKRKINNQKYEINRILDFESDERILKDKIQRDLQFDKISQQRQQYLEKKAAMLLEKSKPLTRKETEHVQEVLAAKNSSRSDSFQPLKLVHLQLIQRHQKVSRRGLRQAMELFKTLNNEISDKNAHIALSLALKTIPFTAVRKFNIPLRRLLEDKDFVGVSAEMFPRQIGLAERAIKLLGKESGKTFEVGVQRLSFLKDIFNNARFGREILPQAGVEKEWKMAAVSLASRYHLVSRAVIKKACQAVNTDVLTGRQIWYLSEILRKNPFWIGSDMEKETDCEMDSEVDEGKNHEMENTIPIKLALIKLQMQHPDADRTVIRRILQEIDNLTISIEKFDEINQNLDKFSAQIAQKTPKKQEETDSKQEEIPAKIAILKLQNKFKNVEISQIRKLVGERSGKLNLISNSDFELISQEVAKLPQVVVQTDVLTDNTENQQNAETDMTTENAVLELQKLFQTKNLSEIHDMVKAVDKAKITIEQFQELKNRLQDSWFRTILTMLKEYKFQKVLMQRMCLLAEKQGVVDVEEQKRIIEILGSCPKMWR